jgi:glucose/arabinose dehydrogenase
VSFSARTISAAALIVVLAAGAFWWRDLFIRQAFAPTSQTATPGATVSSELPLAASATPGADVEVVAQDLNIPWELAWLPNGEILVTERPGRLLKIGTDRAVIEIEGVAHVGEGGLQGLALHPDFSKNQWLYLYLTTRAGEGLINRVERYRLEGTELTERTVILDDIPGAQFHDGGRLAFGPDRLLYITTGDAGTPASAQDIKSLAGKILRVKDDGSIPSDNPFNNAVYSYGHRNPQGLAWDRTGQLWATEHGRSGVQTGFDEINTIITGNNYGWPELEGDETGSGRHAPVLHSGATTTWAPAGAAIVDDTLYFTGLRGESLYSARINMNNLDELTAHYSGDFGRLRAIKTGPDGGLYVTTSNQDGRGNARAGDDKIIRINPSLLLR